MEQWLIMLRVNLVAPIALTRACLPLLKASPDTCIIVTSDTHGHYPAAYWDGFAVAKEKVEVLVKIQAQEWKMHANLLINALISDQYIRCKELKRIQARLNGLPKPQSLMLTYLIRKVRLVKR